MARITDAEEFYDRYFLKGMPVVVAGAAKTMGAFRRWSDRYLRTTLAGLAAMVRFEDNQHARIPIEIFFDYLAQPHRFYSSHGLMYLTDMYVSPAFGDPRRAALAADAAFPLRRGNALAGWTSLYAGPAGTFSPFHQDIFSTHTWLAQLRGKKHWRLCSPTAMVPGKVYARRADILETVVSAGDLIYLPPDWWHEVRNLESTLAVSGNFFTYKQAEAALAEAIASTSQIKDVWISTLSAILNLPKRD